MPDRQLGRRLLTAISNLLRRPAASWLVIGLTVVAAIFLWVKPQAPGVAIGLLAVVSVAMTVARATPLQKLLLVGLAVAMFVLESHAIKIDRDAQDTNARNQLQAILSKNDADTKTILKNATNSLDATQKAFAKSEGELKAIVDNDKTIGMIAARNLSVSNQNLNNLTGASAHPFIMPFRGVNDQVELSIQNTGRYTLTGVSIDVNHASKPLEKHGEYEIGTLPAGQIRRTGIFLPGPFPQAPGWDEYLVSAFAQNGAIVELMDFRTSHGAMPWAYRISANYIVPGSTAMGPPFRPKGLPVNYQWSDEPPELEPSKGRR